MTTVYALVNFLSHRPLQVPRTVRASISRNSRTASLHFFHPVNPTKVSSGTSFLLVSSTLNKLGRSDNGFKYLNKPRNIRSNISQALAPWYNPSKNALLVSQRLILNLNWNWAQMQKHKRTWTYTFKHTQTVKWWPLQLFMLLWFTRCCVCPYSV